MNTTSTQTSAPEAPLGLPPQGHLIGTILVRIVIPLWVVAGASVKLWTFNPALLPRPHDRHRRLNTRRRNRHRC